MDNQTLKSRFFRSISVHLRELQVVAPFFRSIPVHFRRMPSDFPEYIRSIVHRIVCVYLRFRSISVHSFSGFSFLCADKFIRNSTVMAGTTKDMSLIKQVLQLKQAGESNRGISRKLPIDKETVNGYVNTVKANGWNISDLLEIDDPELERMFHAGSPAYTDRRMEEFLILLPRYKELLADPKSHVSRQVLFDEYRATHPDGYGKSQFYYHLKQNLVA